MGQPAIRVDRVGTLADLEIDAGLLVTTGCAGVGDGLAGAHAIAKLHVGGLAVPVQGEVTAIVLDQHDQRSEEHTSELQSLMRISYAVFCLKKKTMTTNDPTYKFHTTHPSNLSTNPLHNSKQL